MVHLTFPLTVPDYRIADNKGLTPREREVFEGVMKGSQNKKIANDMNISLRTVKHNVSEVLRKFGVRNRVELRMSNVGVK